jgi:peptidoglycan/LPS O-acetylase OafA/YrhL
MTQTNMESRSRIVFLDYLRIFAFVSVLAGHKFYGYFDAVAKDERAHATLRLLAKLASPLLYGGGAGVVVFFLSRVTSLRTCCNLSARSNF